MTDLRVVSEKSPEEIARNRELGHVSWKQRELTANLLRVSRGAGRSWDILQQTVDLLQAMQSYRDVVGHWPTSYEMSEAPSIDEERQFRAGADEHRINLHYAEERVLKGAMQVVASRLVGQLTQERRGHGDLMDGINQIEDIRADQRLARAIRTKADRDAQKAALKLRVKRSSTKKPKAPK